MSNSVGFLGAGQMATALARGWLNARLLDLPRCLAADPIPNAREAFHKATSIGVTTSNADVIVKCKTIILAVKPQVMANVLREIRSSLTREHLVISIAAGVPIAKIAEALPPDTRCVRVMPNTPCLVAASATGIAFGPTATADDQDLVLRLFGAVGVAVPVPETQLDAVTGLSGSGPAYVYMMIEALADGGVRSGLPRDVAQKLAVQTVLGTAKMVQVTGKHTGELKDAVASPGGTTIAGIHALEQAGFRGAVMDAVLAATKRATELGQ